MSISCSNAVNNIGLILDILGAILIWKFGLPENVSRDGLTGLATGAPNKEEIKKAKSYDFKSRLGLSMLILGFTVQMFSNFL